MAVDPALILGLIEAVVGLLGKGAKPLAKVLADLPLAQAETFLAAKRKIDEAAAARTGVTLTPGEVEALDYVLDRLKKLARKVKRAMP